MEEYIKFENLIDHTKEYVNTRIDKAKLTVAEKTSEVVAHLIARAVVSLVFIFCLLFASVAAAYGAGLWLGKVWLGFLLVAAAYFLLGWIVWAAKERLIRIPLMNMIIHQLFKNDTDDEED
jgi:uncharacterized membrane protein (DUF2068 family)